MATLDDVVALGQREQFLAVVSTVREDETIQASLVNTGVLDFLRPAGAGVCDLRANQTGNLRARPQIAVTFRSQWQWATVEGRAQLVGPDDPAAGVDAEGLRLLLREVFVAAGGTHDDWAAYDATMLEQRRTAVLITPADRVQQLAQAGPQLAFPPAGSSTTSEGRSKRLVARRVVS